MMRQHKRWLSCGGCFLVALLLLVGLPMLGLWISLSRLSYQPEDDPSRWQSLGAPPEKAREIVTGDLNVVYVRTDTGKIYGCDHSKSRRGENCWHESQEPLQVNPDAISAPFSGGVMPPGTVVDTLEVEVHRIPEESLRSRYVLLSDGMVWQWDYSTDLYTNLMILILGPLCGLALGLVSVVPLLGVGLLILLAGSGKLRRFFHRWRKSAK